MDHQDMNVVNPWRGQTYYPPWIPTPIVQKWHADARASETWQTWWGKISRQPTFAGIHSEYYIPVSRRHITDAMARTVILPQMIQHVYTQNSHMRIWIHEDMWSEDAIDLLSRVFSMQDHWYCTWSVHELICHFVSSSGQRRKTIQHRPASGMHTPWLHILFLHQLWLGETDEKIVEAAWCAAGSIVSSGVESQQQGEW
jgi:hypothetical protein